MAKYAGGNPTIVFTKQIQYQANFVPLKALSSTTPVNLDRWYAQHPIPVRRLKSFATFPYTFYTQKPPLIPVDAWRGNQEVPVRRLKFHQTYPSVFTDALLSLLPVSSAGWQGSNEWPARRARIAPPSEVFFVPLPIVNVETITVDKWLQNQVMPVRRPQFLNFDSLTFVPNFTTTPETITIDKWFSAIVQPNTLAKRYPRSDIQDPFSPAQTVSYVPTFSGTDATIIVTRQVQYQANFNPLLPATSNKVITVDKWFRESVFPTLKRPTRASYPSFAFIEVRENVTMDKWYAPIVQIFRRRPQPTSTLTVTEFVFVPPAPVIPLDRWFAPLQEPQLQKRSYRHIHPFYPALVEFQIPPFWFEKFPVQTDPFTDHVFTPSNNFTDKYGTATDPFVDKVYTPSNTWTDNPSAGSNTWTDKF